jgi:hypothetical protein
MKNTILSILLLAVLSVSCNQKDKETQTDIPVVTKTTSELYSCPMHPEVTGEKGTECSVCGMELTEKVAQSATTEKEDASTTDAETKNAGATTKTVSATSFTINEIVSSYLKLKNALVKDDSKGAANAGKAIYSALNSIDSKSLDAKLKKEYVDIADDAKEHAEHIGDNSGKIEHQREHFAMLSKDINDLIKTFGTTQKLYQDYCPMYDEGKSGYWISETKEIKNPYFGSQMLTCGSVRKTF